MLLISFAAESQTKQKVTEEDYSNNQIEMADTMRSEGKIYVVVAILATVLAGFIVYAIRIDRKLIKLESWVKEKQI